MSTPHSRTTDWRRPRGRAAALAMLVVLVVTAVVQIPAAPKAQAAVHNLFPADVDGFPKGRFRADEALFVTLTSDVYGGTVCVVADSVTDPTTTDCKSPRWGSPNRYVGMGTLLGYPLEAPLLPPGRWKLLSTDIDGKNGIELSETFEVVSCSPNCDTSVAKSQLQPWKDAAAKQVPTAAQEERALIIDIATRTHKIAKGIYGGLGFGLGAAMIGGAWAAANFDFVVPSTEDLAKALHKQLSASVRGMYTDIKDDPPDFDYGSVADPAFTTLGATGDALLDDYLTTLMRAEAYGKASRVANERYQGAVIDADHAAAASQARATTEFTFDFNNELRRLQILQPQVAALGWAAEPIVTAPEGEDASTWWAGFIAGIDDLDASDLTTDDRQFLLDHGITQAEIDAAIASWADPEWVADMKAVDPTKTFRQVLNESTAGLEEAIASFDAFGRWMSLVAADEQAQVPAPPTNHAPVSAFDATHLTGTAPLTVTFTSAATDPDGDALDLTWDIAGTRRVDNETSVTHTFSTPGNYGVSLVATDPDGEWDQAIKWITVYPGTGVPDPDPENQAPVASFSPQWVDREGPFTQSFTASSFDPDGDTLTHTWYFGDGTTETGKSVTKTFPPGFIMSVLLVSSDGTLTGQVAGEVTSRHPGVDPTPNEPPIVGFTADPASGNSPLEVSFASTSTDPDGDPLDHTWYFGDGDTATGADATHTYTTAGTYTATLVVTDGVNSRSTTRQIVVHAVTPINAAFTVARGGDAASTTNGGRILDTGTSTRPGYPVTNLILPTAAGWYSANGVTSPQEIIFDLAGRGRDHLDRIMLRGANASQSVKTFSVALVQGADPFGASTTVVDHATLDRTAEDQTFTFAPQRARFVKLTVHDNHGGTYLRLTDVSVPTIGGGDGAGGIVSLAAGHPASIVSATSEYSTGWAAANILNSGTSQWSSAIDATTDQRIRVRLGGEGAHELSTIALRSSGNAYTVGDFEVYASPTGDDGSWTKVLDDTMAPTNAAQSFTLATPTEASYLELRLNGTGAGRYLYLAELRALTIHGLNVADGNAVGAQVVDASSSYPGYFPASAIAPDTTNTVWLTGSGQVTDQYLTVLLRNGEVATVDRVSVRSATARPRNVKVQTSLDGANFTTVAIQELTNSTSEEQFISFTPVAARFVKLVLDDGYATSYIRVDKFRVYSPDRGAADNVHFVDLSTGTEPAVSWLWNFGDGTTSTDQHPTHTFSGPGTYSVTLAVTDGDGNTSTVTRPYVVPGVPATSMTATVATEESDGTYRIGEGTFTTLTASTTGEPIVAWDWDFDYTKPTTTAATTSA
ncbi:MAG TPA: PKD domain-containing protein, partial [Acidimicrobiales bacterium]|nr:PKD domain-containing protein [Acidimicrobiales bacterium]